MTLNAPQHIVVWLDHQVARLSGIAYDAIVDVLVHNDAHAHGNIHHHAGSTVAGHVALDKVFLEKISDAIGEAREILIVGPAAAKTELKKFLDQHRPLQAKKVAGVEAMDHATGAEVRAFARHFFAQVDRMMPLKSRD